MIEPGLTSKLPSPKRRWFQYRLRTLLLAILFLALYLGTWMGGEESHRQEIRSRAQQLWDKGDKQAKAIGLVNGWGSVLPGGPDAEVNWCYPILPGILIADSCYVVAPLHGEGGVKLILYYGSGSAELFTLWGWVS